MHLLFNCSTLQSPFNRSNTKMLPVFFGCAFLRSLFNLLGILSPVLPTIESFYKYAFPRKMKKKINLHKWYWWNKQSEKDKVPNKLKRLKCTSQSIWEKQRRKTLPNTFYLYHCSVPQKKILSQRSLFLKWVSNEIQNNRCFVLLRSVIGPEDSRQSLNQSDAKLKPITTWSPAFFRALGDLAVFTLSSLAIKGIFNLSSDLPLWLLWFWLWDTQWKGVLIS